MQSLGRSVDMRKSEVEKALAEGQTRFYASVSGQRTTVRITRAWPSGGYSAVNTATGRDVRIKTAARLHGVAR